MTSSWLLNVCDQDETSLLSGVTESREAAGVYYLQFPGRKVVEKYCSPGPVQSLAEILVLW